jgi:hypothetical protein
MSVFYRGIPVTGIGRKRRQSDIDKATPLHQISRIPFKLAWPFLPTMM